MRLYLIYQRAQDEENGGNDKGVKELRVTMKRYYKREMCISVHYYCQRHNVEG